jgi:hypothetical protein
MKIDHRTDGNGVRRCSAIEPKATKKAMAGARRANVAPGKAKAGKRPPRRRKRHGAHETTPARVAKLP